MPYRKKYTKELGEVKEQHILEDEKERIAGKELALAFLTILFAIASWILIKLVLTQQIFSVGSEDALMLDTRIVIFAVVALLLMSFYIVLMRFTVKLVYARIALATLFLSGVIPLFFFFIINPVMIFAGSSIYLVLLFVWFSIVKKADERESDFSLVRTMRPGLSYIIIIIIALVSFFRYVDYVEHGGDSFGFQKAATSYTIIGVNQVFEYAFSGYHANMTVDDFLVLLSGESEAQTDENSIRFIDGILENLPIGFEIEASALEQQRAFVRNSFFENLKLGHHSFTGGTPVTQVWQALLEERATRYTKRFDTIVPFIVAFGLFLTLYLFKFFYRMLVYFFGWITLKGLLLFHFFTWKKKEVPIKTLSL